MTMILDRAFASTRAVLAPVKPDPVTMTLVPPAAGPLVGLIALTVGAAT